MIATQHLAAMNATHAMNPHRALPPEPAWPPGWAQPDLGPHAVACVSARSGGVSLPPFDSCNLGDHVGDDPAAVARNRAAFAGFLPAQAVWLTQVHGNRIARVGLADVGAAPIEADGALTTEPGVACVVMVADCLPLLLAAPEGRGVAALHAGWRGLAGEGAACAGGKGIVQAGVEALCEATAAQPRDLRVWLGPCIGPNHFEVGPEVLRGFGVEPFDASGAPVAHPRFSPRSAGDAVTSGKWLADLPGLARDALAAVGVTQVSGGQLCTVSDPARFFSFRRDGRTGRQAAAICLR